MNIVNILFLFIFSLHSFSQEKVKDSKSSERPKEEFVDPLSDEISFDKIKDVIAKDRLGKVVKTKKAKIEKQKLTKEKKTTELYNVPGAEDFWGFFSEYWLVKNATILKWDFKKPDYGLMESFRHFLEAMGVFELRYKILLVNTPDVTHFSLPSNPGEVIFLLSLPFIRTLDLSKFEISILLFEDYLRAKEGQFINEVASDELRALLGSNFYQKTFPIGLLEKLAKNYDNVIFDKGFNFQQQFKITEKMGSILKSNGKYWNSYYLMLQKIDKLVKSNILYQKYLKIYPSPELQMNWLRPKKKEIL